MKKDYSQYVQTDPGLRVRMNKCIGGVTVCIGAVIILILVAVGFFLFQGADISEDVSGDANVISTSEKKEISIFHIENLTSQIDDLEGQVTTHNTV